ncbi:hypothetical protein ECEC1848_1869, partial [Escherichia coli EC1848]
EIWLIIISLMNF